MTTQSLYSQNLTSQNAKRPLSLDFNSDPTASLSYNMNSSLYLNESKYLNTGRGSAHGSTLRRPFISKHDISFEMTNNMTSTSHLKSDVNSMSAFTAYAKPFKTSQQLDQYPYRQPLNTSQLNMTVADNDIPSSSFNSSILELIKNQVTEYGSIVVDIRKNLNEDNLVHQQNLAKKIEDMNAQLDVQVKNLQGLLDKRDEMLNSKLSQMQQFVKGLGEVSKKQTHDMREYIEELVKSNELKNANQMHTLEKRLVDMVNDNFKQINARIDHNLSINTERTNLQIMSTNRTLEESLSRTIKGIFQEYSVGCRQTDQRSEASSSISDRSMNSTLRNRITKKYRKVRSCALISSGSCMTKPYNNVNEEQRSRGFDSSMVSDTKKMVSQKPRTSRVLNGLYSHAASELHDENIDDDEMRPIHSSSYRDDMSLEECDEKLFEFHDDKEESKSTDEEAKSNESWDTMFESLF